MENSELIKIAATVVALMVAIIGHEIMHGLMAYRYGDNTAKSLGRLSINPLVHVDPVGTILVPTVLFFSGAPFLFGWAKPVPIHTRTVLENGGYKAGINVALAGIYYNFTLALIASVILKYTGMDGINSFVHLFLIYFIVQTLVFNVVLGVFNLYPIPPLDGSHALGYFARWNRWHSFANQLEAIGRYGMIILIVLIATPANQYIFAPMRTLIEILIP